MSVQLRILSAGAVKPGLMRVIDEFQSEMGAKATASFATAPSIRKRITDGEALDILVAPPSVIDEMVNDGKISTREAVILGRIGVGVMVRDDSWLPPITSVAEFKEALLAAESVVYNRASTGIYLETLFDRLDVGDAVKTKSIRYPDFAEVLDHICKGNGRELGLGATTVIIENQSRGVKFVGPLPPEIQNYTAYAAAIVTGSDTKEATQQFIRYLSSPQARALLSAAGIQ
jgi:molybdate transport system substrate-binding protein